MKKNLFYKMKESFFIQVANSSHVKYAQEICDEIAVSAKLRGTGISKRTPEEVAEKINNGKAVIALTEAGIWAGFCYIEAWENKQYISNSGLIVAQQFRKHGLAKAIKQKIFELSRTKYPEAKMFGLTTSAAVMKINSTLGYEPVIYADLTTNEQFWEGCKSCVNYEILLSKQRKNCLCTAMLFDPLTQEKETSSANFIINVV